MRIRPTLRFLTLSLCVASFEPAHSEENTLLGAVLGGKPDLFLRYRFEFADDTAPSLKHAYASTLRSALGYATGEYLGLSGYLQVEDVRVIGNELFNDGGANGVRDRAVVVDPEGTEINQGFLRLGAIARTVVTAGRQEITHRQAPLHRFVGNVLFRQNFQSYDALRVVNLPFSQATLDYAYVWNVNRVFGERNSAPDAADFRMHSHLLNFQYSGLEMARLEGYAYLLDFNSKVSSRFSTAAYGARAQGDSALSSKARLSYALEFAKQTDYRDSPYDIDAHYAAGEIGISYAFGAPIDSLSVKLNHETLSGKGGVNAFQTPLGTNHAFQGTADRFLVTPGDGIKDDFISVGAKALGSDFSVVYHRFRSDRDSYRYGDEWDLLFQKPFGNGLLFGVEYADYRADTNQTNIARNSKSGQAFDLSRLWIYLQFKY
jgi:hypothetical protein